MISRKEIDGLVGRFGAITDQSLSDFSSYEEIVDKGKKDDLYHILSALDSAIRGEVGRYLDEEEPTLRASYLRDLFQLLVEVRQALV